MTEKEEKKEEEKSMYRLFRSFSVHTNTSIL